MKIKATLLTTLILAGSALTGCSAVTDAMSSAAKPTFEGCKAFDRQPDAQRAWEQAGSPKRNDPDGDGEVCVSLRKTSSQTRPTKNDTSCERSTSPVVVTLPREKYPETALHIETAQSNGQPKVLHWQPSTADKARALWERLVRVRSGKDRDEWPMAATREGMRGTSSVAYVSPSDNRGAGSTIASQIRGYCEGTPFRVKITGSAPKPVQILIAANNGKQTQQSVKR